MNKDIDIKTKKVTRDSQKSSESMLSCFNRSIYSLATQLNVCADVLRQCSMKPAGR